MHTGQHYDDALSAAFFRDLELPRPDINLDVGSHSHAVQTARVLERLEPVMQAERPDWVVRLWRRELDAGGGTGRREARRAERARRGGAPEWRPAMPEEINRIIADRLASRLFTPSRDADETLRRGG